MTVTYEASRYSRGRATVMGVATVLILWFHSNVIVPEGSLLEFFKLTGDIGVEMFLIASGAGIYFAVEKYATYRSYILSRLRRVLPVFLLATIPWFLYKEYSWGGGRSLMSVLWNASTLSYWLEGNLTCWYVSSILVLYLLTPAYVKLWKKYPRFHVCAIGAVYLFGSLVVYKTGLLGHLSIFLYRIPVYLWGLSLGKAIREGRAFRINLPLAAAVSAVCLFLVASALGRTGFFVPWSYKYFSYGPLAMVLSLMCSCIPVNPVTNHLGKRSLEIYLLFEKSIEILCNVRPMWALFGTTNIAFCAVALLVTLVGAEILALAAELLVKLPGRMLDKHKQPQ